EPARPSTRVGAAGAAATTASANRRSDPGRLSRALRGELDWVVMKCLEKDRDRRYETAGEVARDVERYLADEPGRARPPSAGYRLRKLARRHKRGLATLAALGVVLLAALGAAAAGLGWTARDRAARQAEAEREKAARQAETERQADQALQEAALLRDRGDWP